MTDDLTRDLNALVPELDASTVLDGAALKRRRTRRRTAALAGALAFAVLTPVMVGLGSVMRSAPQPAASSNGSSAPETGDGVRHTVLEDMEDAVRRSGLELMPPECRAVMEGSVTPDRVPAEGLPDGARRVWLCGELGVSGDRSWVGPRTPLTSHAAEAVAAINALPPGAEEAEQCYGTDSRRYRMVVEYADARHVVDAHTGHCDSVGGTRSGAKDLLEGLKGWFGMERDQGVEVPELPSCTFIDPELQQVTHPLFPIFAPDITRGTACGRFHNGEATVSEDLPEEVLTALRDAPWELTDLEESQPWLDRRGLLIVGNRTGELLAVFRTSDGRLLMPQHGLVWTPDPVTAAWLKDLYTELGYGVINSHACQNTPYSVDVDDSAIVAAHICGEFEWYQSELPMMGSYTLPDALTRQVTQTFSSQAVPWEEQEQRPEDLIGAPFLMLVDAKGVGLVLFPGPGQTLIDPLNKRIWRVPDHLLLPLEARGLLFW